MKSIFSPIAVVLVFSGLIIFLPEFALGQVILALDEQLEDYWVNEKKVAPEYPGRAMERGTSGCVAVGFTIQSDGSTSGHEVLAYYPSKVFDKSAIRAAKQFSYTPSAQNPDKAPVYTLNSFTYQISGGRKFNSDTQKKLAKACKDEGKRILESELVDVDLKEES